MRRVERRGRVISRSEVEPVWLPVFSLSSMPLPSHSFSSIALSRLSTLSSCLTWKIHLQCKSGHKYAPRMKKRVSFSPDSKDDNAVQPSEVSCKSKIEELLELRDGVFWTLDGMTDGSGIFVDLPVVSAWESFVAEEVDVLVVDARTAGLARIRFGFNVLQAVSLVPAVREDVEGDLTTDGVSVIESVKETRG